MICWDQPRTKITEMNFWMCNGVLRMKHRAVLTGYLNRRWNLDYTEDHSLKGVKFHLWLKPSGVVRRDQSHSCPGLQESGKGVVMQNPESEVSRINNFINRKEPNHG